ncbi:hypothetical protein PZB75_16945 [Streptomyces sp. AM 4-1-1]|uniref:hypothetical protein n=1 Tax=unclassified Streptomyces TaxID=2593676 RepID=UPI0023B98BD6|nr:hypothetical protein [Streptomyces sp. AM 4-1-1]WEH34892.1 hypothetical protein PZB75_16945 [Streptomyces sp. AM 4-1-1]
MSGFGAVLLSYDEPLANQFHTRLEGVFGGPVKRLHGVHGMRRAYRLCAEVVDHEQFFLADGDFDIHPAFDTAAVEPLGEGVSMRVWRAVNPVTGHAYGYGGLKLLRRTALRQMGNAVDVLAALPGKAEFAPESAGVTRFNQSPFHAWKAGFRECAMLTRGSEYGMSASRTADRIRAWTDSHDGEYALFVASGARHGVAFARQAARDPQEFEQLNDPLWLRTRFASAHGIRKGSA